MREQDWHDGLDDRELREIAFCRLYVSGFNHGTLGHNLRGLVVKLADKLDGIVPMEVEDGGGEEG